MAAVAAIETAGTARPKPELPDPAPMATSFPGSSTTEYILRRGTPGVPPGCVSARMAMSFLPGAAVNGAE
jgi:hypothetical protein